MGNAVPRTIVLARDLVDKVSAVHHMTVLAVVGNVVLRMTVQAVVESAVHHMTVQAVVENVDLHMIALVPK